jgi:hypothetical protein
VLPKKVEEEMLSRNLQFLKNYHFWISGAIFSLLTFYFLFKITGFWLFPYLDYFIMSSGSMLLFLLTLLTQKKPKWVLISYYVLCASSILLNGVITRSAENFTAFSELMFLPVFVYLVILLIHFISRKTRNFQNYLYVLLGLLLLFWVLNFFISSFLIQLTFYCLLLGFVFVFIKAKDILANEGTIPSDT